MIQKILFPDYIVQELASFQFVSQDNIYVSDTIRSLGMFYLSCYSDCITVENRNADGLANEYVCLQTYDDLIRYLTLICKRDDIDPADIFVMCSSSLDHSDEYTNDPLIVAMCDRIRGNYSL